MIYLFPALDVAGKQPNWSVCIVSLALWILMYMSLIFLAFGCVEVIGLAWFVVFSGVSTLVPSSDMDYSLSSSIIVLSFLVEHIFWHWRFICPFWVSPDSGKFLCMLATVNDGHVL
jgi:hypothetical protein